MASAVIDKIKNCISSNRHFLLDAGAGAGKTHALIQTIEFLQNNPNIPLNKKQNVLCITFTRVAKFEVIDRLKSEANITVMTMHEFLWDYIKQFQPELKKILILMISDEKDKLISEIDKAQKLLAKPRKDTNIEKKNEEIEKKTDRLQRYNNANLDNKNIRYEDFRALDKGVISHDDILVISEILFRNTAFSKIFIDTYTHIFIDEYQDTNKKILNQLLLSVHTLKKDNYLVIGLFGDKMQQIYSSSNEDIDYSYYGFEYIPKLDNYRTCKEIIDSNNSLRGDGLIQEHRNPDIKLDRIEFIFNTSNDIYLKNYKEIDITRYTRLFLSHNEIAKELGFEKISEVFSNEFGRFANDKLLKLEEQDGLIKYILEMIVQIVEDFINGNHNEIIKKLLLTEFNSSYLITLKENLSKIVEKNMSLKDSINLLTEINLIDSNSYHKIVNEYISNDKQVFVNSLEVVTINEYLMLSKQIKQLTKLQTLHGVKGLEFDKVLVNIREGQKWSSYNFDEFFLTGNKDSASLNNTHKLFYVACTRAKCALVINYMISNKEYSQKELLFSNILKLFGNIIKITEYRDGNI